MVERGIRISEERLDRVLARREHHRGLNDHNPVAGLVLEGMAEVRPEYAEEIRYAGAFLLDLLGANDGGAPRLSLPIAMQVLSAEETKPPERMGAELTQIAGEDVLLRLAIDALTRYSDVKERVRDPDESRAVVLILYLLLRMVDAQAEADALDDALVG